MTRAGKTRPLRGPRLGTAGKKQPPVLGVPGLFYGVTQPKASRYS